MKSTLYTVLISRALLCVIIGFITLNAFQTFADKGFTVATSLSELVPSSSTTQAHQQALRAAQGAAEQGVVLVLESETQSSVQQALDLLDEKLAGVPALLHRQNSTDAIDQIVGNLSAFRFHLLSAQDKALLHSGDVDLMIEQALGDLYSPSGGLKLLPLNQDPFNFFSRFIEAGIATAGIGADVSQGLDTTDTDDLNVSMFQEVVNLRLREPLQEGANVPSLIDFFSDLDESIATRYPDVRILRSGVLFFSNEASNSAKKDINLISAGSIIGISVLMLMVFRSIRPLLTASVSIVVGVGFAFSVVHAVYGHIHVFTLLFGASLIGIVIDYSIHYYYHIATVRSSSGIAKDTDRKRLHRALLISLVTSIAGFSALLFSSVLVLKTIAVFSICGIAVAWLTVLALSPSQTSELNKVRQHLVNPVASIIGNVGSYLINRLNVPLTLLGLGAIVGYVLLIGQGQDDPRRFVNLSTELLQQSAQIQNITNEIEPGKFFIVEANNEQALFDRLAQLYRLSENRARLVSVFDWLPSPSQQQLNYQLQAPLYKDAGAASDLFQATGGPPEWLTSLQQDYLNAATQPLGSVEFFQLLEAQMSPMVLTAISPDSSAASYAAFVLLGSGADLGDMASIAVDIDGVSFIDSIADSTEQLQSQRQSSVWLLIIAYAAIATLMWLLYRDRRALVMTSVPAVSTLLTLGVLVLMGQPLTLFHTMSLFLILGLGMDYVVFLVEMTDDSSTTQQAIVLSGLTSMLSFGLLALSSVPVAQAFGLTILIGNGFNLVATLGLSRTTRWQTPG